MILRKAAVAVIIAMLTVGVSTSLATAQQIDRDLCYYNVAVVGLCGPSAPIGPDPAPPAEPETAATAIATAAPAERPPLAFTGSDPALTIAGLAMIAIGATLRGARRRYDRRY